MVYPMVQFREKDLTGTALALTILLFMFELYHSFIIIYRMDFSFYVFKHIIYNSLVQFYNNIYQMDFLISLNYS